MIEGVRLVILKISKALRVAYVTSQALFLKLGDVLWRIEVTEAAGRFQWSWRLWIVELVE